MYASICAYQHTGFETIFYWMWAFLKGDYMPTADQWRQTDENVKWSMTNGGADQKGQAMMLHAARQHNEAYMGEFKDGFYRTQRDPYIKATFDICCRENQGRVYAIGEKYAGSSRKGPGRKSNGIKKASKSAPKKRAKRAIKKPK